MDDLAKSLFNDFEESNQTPSRRDMKRPHTPTNVYKTPKSLPLPSISEDVSFGSPKSLGDSFLGDEFNSADEMMSPPCSPAKKIYSPNSSFCQSPPSLQRGLLALRLFDTPHTPKTLTRNFKRIASNSKKETVEEPCHNAVCPESPKSNKFSRSRLKNKLNKSRNQHANTDPRPESKSIVYANINPFTPSPSIVRAKKMRPDSDCEMSPTDPMLSDGEEDSETELLGKPTKKLELRQTNNARYDAEFVELGKIGTGQFGSVYKCLNRLGKSLFCC